MTESDFLKRLQHAFSLPLPGVKAHRQLASSFRPLHVHEISDFHQYRASAVAIICYPIQKTMHTLLIQRPPYDGHHGGQIALPGGKYEPEDQNLETTARREVSEEIGWTLTSKDCLGQLTELFIPESKFCVQPFVYFCPKSQPCVLDQHEVEHIIEFPLAQLNEPTIVQHTTITLRNGYSIPNVPYFAIDQRIVWGATAIILSELKWMLYSSEH